jgi:hypothetical protein
VSISVAEVVITQALASGSEGTQITASTVLNQNADRIQQPEFNIWPIPNLNWRSDLPPNSRLGLVQAAVTWMKSELAKYKKGELPNASVVLFQAFDDPYILVKEIAAASLRPLIQAFPPSSYINLGDDYVSVERIAERLTQIPKESLAGVGTQFESEIRALLSPVAAEPVSKDRSQTLRPFDLLRPACLRLGEFLTAMGASNRPR